MCSTQDWNGEICKTWYSLNFYLKIQLFFVPQTNLLLQRAQHIFWVDMMRGDDFEKKVEGSEIVNSIDSYTTFGILIKI